MIDAFNALGFDQAKLKDYFYWNPEALKMPNKSNLRNNVFGINDYLKTKFGFDNQEIGKVVYRGVAIFNFTNSELDARFENFKSVYGITDATIRLIL